MPVKGSLEPQALALAPDEEYSEEGSYSTQQVQDMSGSPDADMLHDQAPVEGVVSEPLAESSFTRAESGPRRYVSSFPVGSLRSQPSLLAKSSSKLDTPDSRQSNQSRGFQDVFAAFASASCRSTKDEDVNSTPGSLSHVAEMAAASTSGESLASADLESAAAVTAGESCVTYLSHNLPDTTTDVLDSESQHPGMEVDNDSQSVLENELTYLANAGAGDASPSSSSSTISTTDSSVYFIQTTDASGQLVASIIDPNDFSAYAEHVIYKQSVKPDGEVETVVVHSGNMDISQAAQQEQVYGSTEETDASQAEPQVIYAHDPGGYLIPLDPTQVADDVAPPGKQFVYMQDSSGRIVRTVMDASQNIMPGQQVYYTQNDDGQIVTSLMDPASMEATAGIQEPLLTQEVDQMYQQTTEVPEQHLYQQESSSAGRTSSFQIDNSMSGLSMLAELSHLTAEQDTRSTSLTDVTSSSPATEMYATQSISTYTPRGRGRGRGRSKYYYGKYPGGAAASSLLNQMTSSTSQLSPGSSGQSQSSPQVIRLPLSALRGSGINLKGSSPGRTRYVLVGNSAKTGATSTGVSKASKVVVIKTPGGASNISATQLLRLLQQTGALSQGGTQVTAKLTTAGASSAPVSESYIIRKDGSIVTKDPTGESTIIKVSAEPKSIGTSGSIFEQNDENPLMADTLNLIAGELSGSKQAAESTTVSSKTFPYFGTEDVSQSSSGDNMTAQSREATTASSDLIQSQLITSLADSGDQELSSSSQIGSSSSQPTGKYIQIPNPAGGMIAYQLVMRDGKIVLVPVDKSKLTDSSSTSVQKAGTSTSSPKITIRSSGSSSDLGSVLAQIQKQLQSSGSGTGSGPRLITIPGLAGGKKIQVITVPRSQTSRPGQVLSSATNQQTDQSSISTLITKVSTETGAREDSQYASTVHGYDGSSRGIISALHVDQAEPEMPAVSLLRDVSSRMAASSARTSFVPTSTISQESYRYVLPGSNTTHVLQVGSNNGLDEFDPSGDRVTTMGFPGDESQGHLTSYIGTSTVGTSPMDQDVGVSNMGAGSFFVHTHGSNMQFETTRHSTGGRRGRTRGSGRGSRGPRGRGRKVQLWSSDVDLFAPMPEQIHEFYSVKSVQLSTPPDVQTFTINNNTTAQTIPEESDTYPGIEQVNIPVSENVMVEDKPKVITQSVIPFKVNHGFDILTQGIFDSGSTVELSHLKKTPSSVSNKMPEQPVLSSEVSEDTEQLQTCPAMAQMNDNNENLISIAEESIEVLESATDVGTEVLALHASGHVDENTCQVFGVQTDGNQSRENDADTEVMENAALVIQEPREFQNDEASSSVQNDFDSMRTVGMELAKLEAEATESIHPAEVIRSEPDIEEESGVLAEETHQIEQAEEANCVGQANTDDVSTEKEYAEDDEGRDVALGSRSGENELVNDVGQLETTETEYEQALKEVVEVNENEPEEQQENFVEQEVVEEMIEMEAEKPQDYFVEQEIEDEVIQTDPEAQQEVVVEQEIVRKVDLMETEKPQEALIEQEIEGEIPQTELGKYQEDVLEQEVIEEMVQIEAEGPQEDIAEQEIVETAQEEQDESEILVTEMIQTEEIISVEEAGDLEDDSVLPQESSEAPYPQEEESQISGFQPQVEFSTTEKIMHGTASMESEYGDDVDNIPSSLTHWRKDRASAVKTAVSSVISVEKPVLVDENVSETDLLKDVTMSNNNLINHASEWVSELKLTSRPISSEKSIKLKSREIEDVKTTSDSPAETETVIDEGVNCKQGRRMVDALDDEKICDASRLKPSDIVSDHREDPLTSLVTSSLELIKPQGKAVPVTRRQVKTNNIFETVMDSETTVAGLRGSTETDPQEQLILGSSSSGWNTASSGDLTSGLMTNLVNLNAQVQELGVARPYVGSEKAGYARSSATKASKFSSCLLAELTDNNLNIKRLHRNLQQGLQEWSASCVRGDDTRQIAAPDSTSVSSGEILGLKRSGHESEGGSLTEECVESQLLPHPAVLSDLENREDSNQVVSQGVTELEFALSDSKEKTELEEPWDVGQAKEVNLDDSECDKQSGSSAHLDAEPTLYLSPSTISSDASDDESHTLEKHSLVANTLNTLEEVLRRFTRAHSDSCERSPSDQRQETDVLNRTSGQGTEPAGIRCLDKQISWDSSPQSAIKSSSRHQPFNYRVLTCKPWIQSSERHPFRSLVSKLSSSTSSNCVDPATSRKRRIQDGPAVVKRRRPAQKTESCHNRYQFSATGAIAEVSPSYSYVFTYFKKPIQRRADWSSPTCAMEVAMEDSLSEEELKSDRKYYCKQLLTCLYITAGGPTMAYCELSEKNDDIEVNATDFSLHPDKLDRNVDSLTTDVLKESGRDLTAQKSLEINMSETAFSGIDNSDAANSTGTQVARGNTSGSPIHSTVGIGICSGSTVAYSQQPKTSHTNVLLPGNPSLSAEELPGVADSGSALLPGTQSSARKEVNKSTPSAASPYKQMSLNSSISIPAHQPAQKTKQPSKSDGSRLLVFPSLSDSESAEVATLSSSSPSSTATTSTEMLHPVSEVAQTSPALNADDSFTSPTRRSGRTPIPSKKVLDSPLFSFMKKKQ